LNVLVVVMICAGASLLGVESSAEYYRGMANSYLEQGIGRVEG